MVDLINETTEEQIVCIGVIIAAICIGALYAKMVLIWRDVMIEQNNRIIKDLKKLEQHKNEKQKFKHMLKYST